MTRSSGRCVDVQRRFRDQIDVGRRTDNRAPQPPSWLGLRSGGGGKRALLTPVGPVRVDAQVAVIPSHFWQRHNDGAMRSALAWTPERHGGWDGGVAEVDAASADAEVGGGDAAGLLIPLGDNLNNAEAASPGSRSAPEFSDHEQCRAGVDAREGGPASLVRRAARSPAVVKRVSLACTGCGHDPTNRNPGWARSGQVSTELQMAVAALETLIHHKTVWAVGPGRVRGNPSASLSLVFVH